MIAPPGYPNTRSTPSACTHRKTISAPLSILTNPCHPERSCRPRSGEQRSRRIPTCIDQQSERHFLVPLGIHYLCSLRLRRIRRLLCLPTRQPAHHAAPLRPHNLDRMLLISLAQLREGVTAVLVFLDPLPSKCPVLNLG